MAFEGLAEKLQNTFKKLKRKGKISEKDLKEALREVKLALLEADVNYKVVKDFIANIKERSLGKEVMESLTPGQQVIKIVKEEMTELMGGTESKIEFTSKPPTILMLVGLQGAGKTTTAGKLGGVLSKQGKNPLLVACDIYRPAAIEQLQVVGDSLGIPVFTMKTHKSPIDIAKAGVEYAKQNHKDLVIIDTAGRLHIDEDLMDELKNIKNSVFPTEILLVVDAMTGQDAVTVSESFNKQLGIDGIILTKLDGDTRGGAALSVRAVTGKPIKYVGMGEKLTDLEVFHPDRMASRILGMGDVLSLIEKAQENFDEKKAIELEKKLRSQQFTFEDFLEQLQQVKNMGPLSDVLGMLPGINSKKLKGIELDDRQLIQSEAIINSMTKEERRDPSLINASRRKRIALGSGTKVQDVNKLIKSFEQTKKMMKQLSSIEKGNKKGRFKFPFM
ncbi:signal recognition particle protein [Garciella nitratireducens]|uniref:Signal recognition particle protein n=1 Tax=Garciella nitratireducens DSM 15102 TaxID=1121911 RepID=A0A1T4JXR8_9FIRM|nr:signal recognition particle protein [Garciella nitratireducens]SJZ35006.1 signal recognition particle subunit FFH/SRP54 (srp54) [Garciella nitratireducens DSM 15102]